MPLDIGTLSATVTLEDQLNAALNQVAATASRSLSGFEGIVGIVTGACVTAAAAIGGMTAAIIGLGERGSDVNDVAQTLEHFAGSAEAANEKLSALREGTLGTVDDFALTKEASRLLSAGVKLTTDDFSTLGQAAFMLQNRGLGPTKDMMDLVSTALITGRTRALAMKLGVVDLGNATENYAVQHGILNRELTATEKAEAARIQVLGMLRPQIQDAGVVTRDFGEQLEYARAKMKNFFNDLAGAVAASPAVNKALTDIGDAILKAFGDTREAAIAKIVGWVESFSKKVSEYGPPIIAWLTETGKWAWDLATRAFAELKKAYDVIDTAFSTAVSKWNALPTWLQDVAKYSLAAAVALRALGAAIEFVAATKIAQGVITQLTMIAEFGLGAWASTVLAPLALAAAAIVALGVVIYELVKHWDTVKAVAGATWDFVRTKTETAFTAIKTAIQAAAESGIGRFVIAVGELFAKVAGWTIIASALIVWDQFNGLVNAATKAWNLFKGAVTLVWDGLKAFGNWISGPFNTIMNMASKTFHFFFDPILAGVEKLNKLLPAPPTSGLLPSGPPIPPMRPVSSHEPLSAVVYSVETVGRVGALTAGLKGLTAATDAQTEAGKKTATMTKEQALAWQQLNAIGKSYGDILKGVAASQITTIQGFLEHGASLELLAQAYPNLTKVQMQAIQGALEYTKAWTNLSLTGQGYLAVLGTLTPAQQQTISDYLAQGRTVDELAKAFPNLTAAQITAVDAMRQYSDAWEIANTQGQVWRNTLTSMSADQIQTIQYYLDMKLSVEQVAAMFPNLTRAQVDAVKSQQDYNKAAGVTVWTVQGLESAQFGLMTQIGQTNDEELKAINGQLIHATIMRQFGQLTGLGAQQTRLLNGAMDDLDAQFKAGKISIEEYNIRLKQTYNLYAALGWVEQSVNVGFENTGIALENVGQKSTELDQLKQRLGMVDEQTQKVAKSFSGKLLDALSGIPGTIVNALTGGGGFWGAAQAIGSQFGSLLGESLFTSLGKAFGGLTSLAGENVGKLIGSFSKFLPGIGAAIGSLVGPLINWIKGLFDHVPDDLRAKARVYGVTLSDEVMKGIRQDMDALHLTEQAATIFNASEMFPTVDAQNFSQALNVTRDAFSMVATKQLTVAQGAQTLNEMWPKLAAAGVDAYGLIDAKLVELIKLNDQYGTKSKEIIDFVKGQMTSALEGFGKALAVPAEARETLSDVRAKMQAIDDKQTEMMRRGQQTSPEFEALSKEWDALKQQSEELNAVIDITSLHSQDAANAVSASLVGMVDANIASGMTFMDAVRQVAPAVTDLQAQFEATGYSGGAAFDYISGIVKMASDNIAGPALQAVAGYSQGLVGLANAGILDQNMFLGLSQQIGGTEAALEAQGYTHQQVMAAMQTDLQRVWELQDKYGYKLDETTQALIDEGVETGVLGEVHKSTSDQMLTALNKMVELFEKIANKMGILPEQAEKAAKGISEQFGKVNPKIKYTYEPTNQPPAGVEEPKQEAAGEYGYAAGPMTFSTRGNEYFAFGGEGKGPLALGDPALKKELVGLRRDMMYVLPNQIAKAVIMANEKSRG